MGYLLDSKPQEQNNLNHQQTMAKKATKSFILRVDSDTMDAIEKWAADEFRSTNGQLQWIITEALRKARRLPKKKKTDTDNQTDDNGTD